MQSSSWSRTSKTRLADALTDPRSKTTTLDYNTLGDLISVTDPLNHTTTFTYDDLGRRTGVTDPLDHTTTTAYDARGRVTSITNHDGTCCANQLMHT